MREIPLHEERLGLKRDYDLRAGNKTRLDFGDDPTEYVARRLVIKAYAITAQTIADTLVPERQIIIAVDESDHKHTLPTYGTYRSISDF